MIIYAKPLMSFSYFSFIKHLGAEYFPKRFDQSIPYHLEHITLCVTFLDLNQVYDILALIRRSPNLRSLEIDVMYLTFYNLKLS